MASIVHSIDYLRKLLDYDPEKGTLMWRDVSFETWANGAGNTTIGHYERWRRMCGGKPVRWTPTAGTFVVGVRSRAYTLPRLVWALHYGEFPPADRVVMVENGDRTDIRISNLSLAHSAGAARRKVPKPDGLPPVVLRQNVHSADFLRKWLRYEDGDLIWQDPGFEAFAERFPKVTRSQYKPWAHRHTGRPVAASAVRSGRQYITIDRIRYDKAGLVYSICKGVDLNPSVAVAFLDGDARNFRIENLELRVLDGEFP